MICSRNLQDKVEIIPKSIPFCFPEMSILPPCAPAQPFQEAAPASSLLTPHKQLLPLSPPFSVSLPNAPVGDAADRAVAGDSHEMVVMPPWLVPCVLPPLLLGGLAAAGCLPRFHVSLLPRCRSHDITGLVQARISLLCGCH